MIGIFGGTFNPPHIGHLILAENALKELKLEKVIFVPSIGSPSWYKESPIVDFEDRYSMVGSAICNRKEFELSDVACLCGSVTYTIEILRELNKSRTNKNNISLLMGPDAYSTFWEWNSFDEILRSCKNIAVAGKDFFMPDIDIRSSIIRDLVKEGKSIRYLVPDVVCNYIEFKGLYKE